MANKFAYMTVVLKQNVTAFYCLAKQFSSRSIAFSTEHRETALRLANLITEQTQAVVDISAKMTRRNGHPVTSTVTVPDEDQRLEILQYFGHTGKEVTLRINHDMIKMGMLYGCIFAWSFFILRYYNQS